MMIDETLELHQLNLELLDVLGVLLSKMIAYCNKASIPYDDSIMSLFRKATAICDEIHATSKPNIILQRGTSSDEFLQRKRPDKDFTEP
jgi:hypothetical protein